MSSEAESPQVEEAPAKTEKAGGRRNPRRSTRNANPIKSEDSPESRKPSKKGSESRVTRSKSTRSRKKSGSPTFRSSKGSAGEDNQESPAARVKSSRRASSRVNYKESEGEEDALPEVPKEEEEFISDDDWENSDGEGGKKKRDSVSRRAPVRSSRKGAAPKETRSRPSRTANRRSDRNKRGKKNETEEEEEEEEEEPKEKEEDAVDEDRKDVPLEEEVTKTENSMDVDKEVDKASVENQIDEKPPSENTEKADTEKKEEKEQDSLSPESAKRKLEDVVENDEMEQSRKKAKVEDETVKSNEYSSYHRSSPVIVENKQFTETSTPMEVDSNAQNKATPANQNDSSAEHSSSSHPLESSSLGINGSSMLAKPTNAQSIPGPNGTFTSSERLYISNPSLPLEKIDHLRPHTFTLVSYNLQGPDSVLKENSCASELKIRKSDLVCLQSITPSFFAEKIQSLSRELGYHEVLADGLTLLYKPEVFDLVSNSPISLQSLIKMDLEGKPPEIAEAVAKYLNDLCCKAHVVELRSLLAGGHLLRLCNVTLPTLLDPSCTTLLMCRLLKEVNTASEAPHILCGEFNPVNWVSQVLTTGQVSEELVQEMRRRKDIFLPNQESISLIEVLPSLHFSTSLQYTNCYTTVMGSQKSSGGSDQVWASSGSLSTLGVWEPNLALQARLAFSGN